MVAVFERRGFVRGDNLAALKDWCVAHSPKMRPSYSQYVIGYRWESWFEKECKLSYPVEVINAPHNERIYQLGQRLFPGNHCCLFLHYSAGSLIRPHRDHTATDSQVVQVNIGCPISLTVGDTTHEIEDGEAVSFNSKIPHSTSAAPTERWVVSWRRIKPIHLNPQLSLL